MSSAPKFRGRYDQIISAGDAPLNIPNIVIQSGSDKLEISNYGVITASTNSVERLDHLKVVALVSARAASDWRPLTFKTIDELEDGKPIRRERIVTFTYITMNWNG
ncbi:MAG: hypothetical protein ACLPY5_04680 [Candidatus Bathyarchaeia archaeon]